MKHVVRVVIMAAMLLILAVPVEAAGKNARLNTTSITMSVGTKTKLKLMKYKKLSKKQLKKVKWTSSNKKVATVKCSGKYKQNATITAKASGNATIKLKYNGKTYRCKLTVNQRGKHNQKGDVTDNEDEEDDEDVPEKKTDDVIAATSIKIDQGSKITLTEGDTYQLTATVVPSNAPVIWCSNNPSVAMVDQNGLVTVLKGGKVGISCVSKNTSKPKTSIMSVTVNLKPKYTYECYLLGDVYNGGFYANGLYDSGYTPIYIKTDNPNPETIEMQYVPGYGSNNTHDFADVKYTTETDEGHGLRRVEGGYLGLLAGHTKIYEEDSYSYKKLRGTVTSLIREYATADHSWSQPYAEAGTFTFEIRDYLSERNAWMDKVIAEQTTPDMNVHEKMMALSKYITLMDYIPQRGEENMTDEEYKNKYGNGLIGLTNKIGPFWISNVLESAKGPSLLELFGERIGYEVESGHDVSHGYVRGVYDGVTYEYLATPMVHTGYFEDCVEKSYIGRSDYYYVEAVDPFKVVSERINYPGYERKIQYVDFGKFQ